MNTTHNTLQEQKQISIQLGSHSRIAFQVWDEERGKWFKSESSAPLRDRDIPRPTQKRILEPAPKGGWRTRVEEIPEDAPVYRNMEHLCRLLQHNKGLVLGVETTVGNIVRICGLSAIHHQLPAYIPALYAESTAGADAKAMEEYREKITHCPPVGDDFPWYADQFWNGFVGGDTELWVPASGKWMKAKELEFPACAEYRYGFLTMEQEHGYGEAEITTVGEVRFDWFPVLYQLVLERPCELEVQAGYRECITVPLTVRAGYTH